MNKVTVSAAIIWTVGIVLSFIVPPKSPYLWIPDTLLLVGFLPFLYTWKPFWPWLIFGVGNLIIGFVIEVSSQLPDAGLPPSEVFMKNHLAEMHVAIVWLRAGLLSIAYGIFRLIKQIAMLITKRSKS